MTETNRNLASRVVTALVLLPVVLWLIWQGGLAFALLSGVAAALAALELNLLQHQPGPAAAAVAAPPAEGQSRKERKKARAEAAAEAGAPAGAGAAFSGAAILSAGAAFLLPLLHHQPLAFLSVEMVLAAVALGALCDALFFEQQLSRAPLRVGLSLLGAVWGGLMMSALVRLRQLHGAGGDAHQGFWWVVLALTVTWANDTGAYFAGRAFGKHKLYPRISPKKTVEGAVGGMFASTAGALVVAWFWLPPLPLWGALLIGLGASVLGPIGDLSESMLKRAFDAKDSGGLLPGHGGMLDRIDALLFNAPFVLLCARLFLRQ